MRRLNNSKPLNITEKSASIFSISTVIISLKPVVSTAIRIAKLRLKVLKRKMKKKWLVRAARDELEAQRTR